MNRCTVTFLALMALTSVALAQIKVAPRPGGPAPAKMNRPAQPQPAVRGVPVDQKLRYICKQLNLDEKQKQHVDGLFDVLKAELNKSPDEYKEQIEQIRQVWQERKAALDAGDNARAAELLEKLKNMAPTQMAENGFVAGLLPILNDAQKTKFESLRKQLENATDLTPKPIQIVRLARKHPLTPEQQEQLEHIMQTFRESVAKAGNPEAAQREELVNKLVTDIAAILKPEQREEFNKQVNELRPDETAPVAPAASPMAPFAQPGGPG